MHRLKSIQDRLICSVESQVMGNLEKVCAKELGEVVDMIKDIEEAKYYCAKAKALESKAEEKHEHEHEEYHHKKHYPYPMYYTPMPEDYPYSDARDMDRKSGRMYYDDKGMSQYARMNTSNRPGNTDYPAEIRDVREGRSPISRKSYMESKEMHKGVSDQMKELERYLQELSHDITEMVEDASPEEKTILQQKLTNLANKIK